MRGYAGTRYDLQDPYLSTPFVRRNRKKECLSTICGEKFNQLRRLNE